MKRPDLTTALTSSMFLQNYYLKEELIAFCRREGLPVSGGKPELNKRIAKYLDDGSIIKEIRQSRNKAGNITKDSKIIENVSYSEDLRAFFKQEIGASFTFNVPFQRWLKDNAGKTYAEAIIAYQELKRHPKKKQIDHQFEYNTYIRDFFQDNPAMRLADAIACWNYKKNIPGSHHRYEPTDLQVLKK